MKNKTLFIIWGCLYIICVLLGFIPEPTGFLKFLLVTVSLGFFVPGGILLYRASQTKDLGLMRVVRSLSLLSLGSTLIFLVLNLISGNASAAAGELLYGFLIIFSSPMVCSQYWVASIFLWACLLMTSISMLRKEKKKK